MHYNRDVFVTQFERVKWFVYHLTYYRILQKGYEERQLQSEFWTLTIDAHLLRATIDWGMVFGNKNEPTHWRRLVKQSEGLVRNFHEGLFQELGLDEKPWEEYWQGMIEFRNKYAAHRELEPFKNPVPNFDTALGVAFYYDKWVRKIISPGSFGEPSLEWFAKSLEESATPFLNKLLSVTEECR